MALTIEHTEAEGTLLHGTSRGDGSAEIVKGLHRFVVRPLKPYSSTGMKGGRIGVSARVRGLASETVSLPVFPDVCGAGCVSAINAWDCVR